MSGENTGNQSFVEESDAIPARFGSRKLVPLKTTLETRARDTVINVYVTLVPVKQASTALK
jgi:tRNA-specific adenosine deaminase 3